MDWYDKLSDYFPEHEMKNPQHLKDLIADKDIYHKEENSEYITLYAEFPSFVFIDYLLVTSKQRGKGIGTRVLDGFKAKGKLVLLEAEPKDPDNDDAQRRLNFYARNGFKQADQIVYERENDEGESFRMHILYWAPAALPQEEILTKMAMACKEIHNYRSKRYYGRVLADPEEVLRLKTDQV
ncbi:GNAT family N-acetyltransferase [Paenibacillus sp. IB182496]|uniref:GNAT family N-acetyltransferase n=1 Tax=Paenibacillus sabuli TaxID=2772509 RepID=A0A927GSM7_9BACL|nr:GNAT family N-acetyltransferase [Paenibacillus sabuli]MBD2846914.1 GNAT family N-acetyltransferase [Paenibacillus sabuli]